MHCKVAGSILPTMKTFSQALSETLAQEGSVSLRRVALGSGVNYEQLKKVVSKNHKINYEAALKVAQFFGQTLEQFLEVEANRLPYKIADAYARLSDDQRLHLQGYLEGLAANPAEEFERIRED